MVDTHANQQEHRLLETDVYSGAGRLPEPPSSLSAPLTPRRRGAAAKAADGKGACG